MNHQFLPIPQIVVSFIFNKFSFGILVLLIFGAVSLNSLAIFKLGDFNQAKFHD
jgi:hypothetical protein